MRSKIGNFVGSAELEALRRHAKKPEVGRALIRKPSREIVDAYPKDRKEALKRLLPQRAIIFT